MQTVVILVAVWLALSVVLMIGAARWFQHVRRLTELQNELRYERLND